MRVQLNLATSPLESNRRFAVGAATVAVLSLAATFVLSWHAYSVRRSENSLRAEQAQLEADTRRLRDQRDAIELFFNRPETVQRRDLAAFLNGLIAQRAFPWTKIFMDLERSLPDGVRIISIEPKLVEDHVQLRLAIGASSDEGKLKFLEALEDSTEFSEIEVLSETRPDRPADTDRVVLSIVARYSVT